MRKVLQFVCVYKLVQKLCGVLGVELLPSHGVTSKSESSSDEPDALRLQTGNRKEKRRRTENKREKDIIKSRSKTRKHIVLSNSPWHKFICKKKILNLLFNYLGNDHSAELDHIT